MADTIYNWGRERKVRDRKGGTHKIPNQMLITDKGLKPSKVPVYQTPPKISTISRGMYDYDPLGNA